MDAAEKRTLKAFLKVMVGVLIYTAMHFTLVDYRGQKMVVITSKPFSRGFRYCSVIGSYTLETEYGFIKVGTLAKMALIGNTLYWIETGHYTVSHDLRYLGVKLPRDATVIFNRYTHQEITDFAFSEDNAIELPVGNIPFKVKNIFFPGQTNEPVLLYFARECKDRVIELSDGTRIQSLKGELNIRFHDGGVWQMGESHPQGRPSWKTFLVTFPGEEEGKAYGSVRFRENWGPFVDGELTVEQESTLF